MRELIKTTKTSQGSVVNARDLYEFLETKEHFTQWIKRMLDYGFSENNDYQAINNFVTHDNGIGGTIKADYILTLDCAKEISMIQRSEKGKMARLYFIECEKKLKEVYSLPQSFPEALRLLADTKEREEKALLELKSAQQKIESDQPKVLFAESVTGSSNSILVRQFAKDLCGSGFEIGQNRLYQWFRKKGFLNIKNEPYQNYVSQGLFEVITRTIGSGDETFTTKTTKVTGRGAVYFTKKIKDEHPQE